MSAFEFFFGFYGLILGLSVVEIIGGFARALRARKRIRLGYCTPLLALFLLLDLISFWTGSWTRFQNVEISPGLLVTALAIAGLYYLAASLVFPDFQEWETTDDFYDGHKVWVLLGSFVANLLAFTTLPLVAGDAGFVVAFWTDPSMWMFLGPLFAMMLGVALIRDRRINVVLLALICLMYAVDTFI
ncbi:MAG: hypothetical protein KJ676_06880 [Alphaproteobacteria bacterium]|nr:hypothetical protein [Alphaproteobacteria bacterium]MBU1526228.1 hypothetical protein [Alphaproteobacteria bacterium]MBU2116439.1 hypothetical protein [Alphaproteobacteria bacterium]MBU2351385.1 hypothetical protein [Alphaproteobacteria bacterium]MBU2382093.1 hypothetical protein [Alphaproteobacteria bacterium]